MANPQTIYNLQGLTRVYTNGGEEVRAVDDASLDLYPGRFVLVNGKSGSGKTTLLNLLGELETSTAGEILFKGKSIAAFSQRELTRWRRHEVGFVFQAFALLPGLTAQENVDLPF